jgi:hypothetical protein
MLPNQRMPSLTSKLTIRWQTNARCKLTEKHASSLRSVCEAGSCLEDSWCNIHIRQRDRFFLRPAKRASGFAGLDVFSVKMQVLEPLSYETFATTFCWAQSVSGGCVARRSRIHSDMLRSSRPAAAGPAAHCDRIESHVIYGTGHLVPLFNSVVDSAHATDVKWQARLWYTRKPRQIRT